MIPKITNEKIELFQLKPLNTAKHIAQLIGYFNQKVWLSPTSNLNDPFEGYFKPEYPAPNSIKKTKFYEDYFNFFKENGQPNLTIDDFDKILEAPNFNEIIASKNNEAVRDVFKNHSALCFISSPSNIPMWAHYGNDHTGYCLMYELDFAKLFEAAPLSSENLAYVKNVLLGNEILSLHSKLCNDLHFVFTKVAYSSKIPTLAIEKFISSQDGYERTKYLIQNSIGCKFMQWSYEEEYRLITNQNSKDGGLIDLNNFLNFLKITGVIMGSQIDETLKPIFHMLCKTHKINLFQAKCSEAEYKIDVIPVSVKLDSILTENQKKLVEA